MPTTAHTVVQTLLQMVFPQPKKLRLYESLHSNALARTSTRSIVHLGHQVVAPLPFDHALVSGAIHAAKYHGHDRAAELLGCAIAPFVAEELAERRMFGTYSDALIVPLPLHKNRERERGYNQATRIAHALIAELNDDTLQVRADILQRVKHTAPQAQQTSRLKRSENVRGAFAVHEPEQVRGRYLLLLDDVVTTGATLHAAREAVIQAGARDVLLVAAAH